MKALHEEETYDIPMTPLIDVVFLLLIFFLAATNFSRMEMDHAVTLPESEAAVKAGDAPERLVVNIREEGTIVVNGRVTTEADLRVLAEDFAAARPGRSAVIRADARVAYSAVMRVFGLCRAAGVQAIDLPVLEPGARE